MSVARRVMALFLSLVLLCPVVQADGHSAGEVQDIEKGILDEILAAQFGEGSYASYREDGGEQEIIAENIQITSDSYLPGESRHCRLDTTGIWLEQDASASFRVQVPYSGLYAIGVRYIYEDMDGLKSTVVSLSVDGKVPFTEAQTISLPRVWTQEAVEHRNGANDFLPDNQQLQESYTYWITDESGLEGIYLFSFEAGQHTLSIASHTGSLCIEAILMGKIASMTDATQAETTTLSPAGENLIIEAEEMWRKSHSSITAGYDRSTAAVSPSDATYRKLNILSGSKFQEPTQYVTWRFQVEKSGRYRLGVRYKQDAVQGMFVTRRVFLDGQSVCESLDAVRFPYGNDWQYQVLAGEAGDVYLDLEAGYHELTMQVTLGDLQPYVRELNALAYALNYLYRKIVMVTGTAPDSLRDYYLNEEIPYLVSTFEQLRQRMQDLYDSLQTMGIRAGQISIINQTIRQLEDFIDDPYSIQNYLSAYEGNISAISALVMTLQQQPLTLEYRCLIGSQEDNGDMLGSFWEDMLFSLKAFIYSFICDYSSISGLGDQATGESIEVWFSGGREQAEMLKSIVDEQFSLEKGIGVDLKLVTISLSQAILAGTAPDVQLTASRSQPVNLGARGVLQKLNDFPDFETVATQFEDTLLTPYTYKSNTYALPVTLSYFLLFYRQDILQELALEVPQTWDDLYAMIPVLQRNHMSIGLPYTMLSSQATIDSGIGNKDIFCTLLLQNGVSLYNDALTEVQFEDAAFASVFQEWTRFYAEYQFDLEFNFYNRFRTGQMPIAIQGYDAYNLLSSAAPEIRGQWGMALVPGIAQADGTINRSIAASGSGVIMLKDSDHKQEAWEFIKWWVSADAQAAYGNALEELFGKASRYTPANAQAVKQLPWTREELSLLLEQRASIQEIPEVLGSYYTVRCLDNAFRNVYYSGQNFKEALAEQGVRNNAELARKQREFG